MALQSSGLEAVRQYLKGEVLSLGYPDLLFDAEGPRHSVTGNVETCAFFSSLGVTSFRCVDNFVQRGYEEIADLDYPLELGEFDLVLDCGTVEHCFNVGQAILNAAGAVRVGGHIFHSPPVSMVNHGFYNVCPTLLYDFYTQNGWEIEKFRFVDVVGRVVNDSFTPTKRLSVDSELSMQFLAKRIHNGVLRYPRQTKYGGGR